MLSSYIASNYAIYAASGHARDLGFLVGPAFLYPTSAQPNSHCEAADKMFATSMTSKSDGFKHEPHNSPCAMDSLRKTNEYSNSEIKFSIDRILSDDSFPRQNLKTEDSDRTKSPLAGSDEEEVTSGMSAEENVRFAWLQCTRYKPPKLQRMKKKDGEKKRKLGRNPRVPFTQHQVLELENKFCRTHYLSSMDVVELSSALNLTETRVKIWFQNRRARERRDRECNKSRPDNSSSNKQFSPPPNKQWSAANSTSPVGYRQFPDALHISHSAFTPLSLINYSGQ